MKYKALFLDLDGTILNTLKDIAIAVNFSLKKHHLPLKSDEQIRSYLGHGSYYLIHMAMDNNPDEKLFKSVFDVYKQYYLTHPAIYTKPYDDVLQILTEFKSNGGKLALISNKPHDIACELLDKFFPNLFDTIYGQKENINTKPDPTSCKLAMKDLQISNKKDILYLGDSLVDLKTAINSGLDCLLCNYGFELEENIIQTKNPYINKFSELRGYIY